MLHNLTQTCTVLTQVVIFNIFYFLVRMSDNTVDIVSDYEVETSYASAVGTILDSHLPHLSNNHLDPKRRPLLDDSE